MQIFSVVAEFLITRFMDNLISLIAIFFVAVLVDVYMYREYMSDKRRYDAARTEWPKVIGKVTSTRRHDGAGYQSVGHQVAGSHYNMVTYAYQAGNKLYKKTEYVSADRSFLDRFPNDTEVTVFYNPLNPKDAMWEYSVEPDLSILKLLNIIILIFAILAMLLFNP